MRLLELEVGEWHHVTSLVAMAVLHACTRLVVSSVEEDDTSGAAHKKTDSTTEPCDFAEDEQAQDEQLPEDAADAHLPLDCVELSEEEALKLCEGVQKK